MSCRLYFYGFTFVNSDIVRHFLFGGKREILLFVSFPVPDAVFTGKPLVIAAVSAYNSSINSPYDRTGGRPPNGAGRTKQERKQSQMRYGALEAGGTKMVCAVGNEKGEILEQQSFATKTPEETVPALVEYFKGKEIAALGIGAFGPVDVVKTSPTYGQILQTPKLAWRGYNIEKAFSEALGVPIGMDTDVGGSCLGEVTYGAAKGLQNVVYITVGTGIGAGIYCNGAMVHGMLHPEAGHMLIRTIKGDPGKSVCPSHEYCLEGLASGPSIEKRWGKKAAELKDDSLVWELESFYLSQAIANFILILSPERIILGGGVMHQEQLFPMIRKQVPEMLNGYYDTPALHDMEHYIVPASLGGDQGIMGAVRLAELAYQGK